jgi:hypothetical protein
VCPWPGGGGGARGSERKQGPPVRAVQGLRVGGGVWPAGDGVAQRPGDWDGGRTRRETFRKATQRTILRTLGRGRTAWGKALYAGVRPGNVKNPGADLSPPHLLQQNQRLQPIAPPCSLHSSWVVLAVNIVMLYFKADALTTTMLVNCLPSRVVSQP